MNSIISAMLAASPEGQREMNRARLRVAVAEELALRMEQLHVSKAQLAEKLGVSRSAITQAFSGDRNLSLNTLADVAAALRLDVQVLLQPQAVTHTRPQSTAGAIVVRHAQALPAGQQMVLAATQPSAQPNSTYTLAA